MAYQSSDITTKVRLRIRDTGFSSTNIVNYLNDTINDVFNEYPHLPFWETSQTYTVTVGDSDITHGSGLPTNYVQALDLLCTYTGLEGLVPYKDIREIDYLNPDVDDTTRNPASVARYWYFYAQTIRTNPVPDKAYTYILRYYKKPTALTVDASVPEIPSQFEELLVVGAAYRCMQEKDNYDQAAILQNKYDEQLQKLVMQTAVNQVGTPYTMPINRVRLGKTSF